MSVLDASYEFGRGLRSENLLHFDSRQIESMYRLWVDILVFVLRVMKIFPLRVNVRSCINLLKCEKWNESLLLWALITKSSLLFSLRRKKNIQNWINHHCHCIPFNRHFRVSQSTNSLTLLWIAIDAIYRLLKMIVILKCNSFVYM